MTISHARLKPRWSLSATWLKCARTARTHLHWIVDVRLDHFAEIRPADGQHYIAEMFKVDLACFLRVGNGNHGQQLFVRDLLAHGAHSSLNLEGIDRATPILVERVESCQRLEQPEGRDLG